MPKPITRLGDVTTGHGCWPSRPSDSGSNNVFVNNISIIRMGDHYITHCCGPACHDGVLLLGSTNVFANNLEVGRVTDPVTCGDFVAQGSSNVFAN